MIAGDLSGKKICWNDGGTGMFAADGQFTNRQGRHSTWSIAEPGIVKIGLRYIPYQMLPDGRFYVHTFCGRCGSITGNREIWGTVCN